MKRNSFTVLIAAICITAQIIFIPASTAGAVTVELSSSNSSEYEIGILQNVYTNSNGNPSAAIVTSSGEEKEYSIDSENFEAYQAFAMYDSDLLPVMQRVIEYSASDDLLTIHRSLSPYNSQGCYNPASNTIGEVRLSDNTSILMLLYNDKQLFFCPISAGNLSSDCVYSAYGYNQSDDGSYGFVLITSAVEEDDLSTPLLEEYPYYAISDITFASEPGTVTAHVSISEIVPRISEDSLILAVYDTDGILLYTDYIRCDFETYKNYDFPFSIPYQASEIGSVKAFMWYFIGNIQPLCSPKEVSV